jgi:hypothetical protein
MQVKLKKPISIRIGENVHSFEDGEVITVDQGTAEALIRGGDADAVLDVATEEPKLEVAAIKTVRKKGRK